MHTHMNSFIFLIGKVFVNPNFDDLDLDQLGLKFWDVTTVLYDMQILTVTRTYR